jgi:hypothetical protein
MIVDLALAQFRVAVSGDFESYRRPISHPRNRARFAGLTDSTTTLRWLGHR